MEKNISVSYTHLDVYKRQVSEQSNSAFSVGKLPYDLLERVALRITEEVPGINRVTYDVTGSRYSMIEWE